MRIEADNFCQITGPDKLKAPSYNRHVEPQAMMTARPQLKAVLLSGFITLVG